MQKLISAVIVLSLLVAASEVFADDSVTGTIGNGPYTTDGTLTATAVVNRDKTVFFGATGQIVLKPGFHAKSGSVFRAKIGNYSTLKSNTDADGDRKADWWELTHFGTKSYTPATDRDGDGVPDFVEVVYGTSPTNGADKPEGVIRYEYDKLGRITKIYRF